MNDTRGAPAKYPWDEWFSRAVTVLKRGKDFNCQPHSMGVMIRQKASCRGVSVSVKIQDNVVVMEIL